MKKDLHDEIVRLEPETEAEAVKRIERVFLPILLKPIPTKVEWLDPTDRPDADSDH